MSPFCKASFVKYNLMTGEGEANEEWYKCFGIVQDGRSIKDLFSNCPNIHPVDNYSIRTFLQNARKGYEKKYKGYVRVRINGIDDDWRWLQANIIVTKYQPEHDIIEALCFNYDITSTMESGSSKFNDLAHMSDLLQSLNTIPWSFDFRTNILTTHREFISHRFSFDSTTHKETYQEFLARVKSDQREEVDAVCKRLHQGIASRAVVQCQIYMSPEKPAVWVELSMIVNEIDEHGCAVTAIGTTTIIQERKEAEHAINVAKEKAERANQIKTNFLANMTHEFRTPLNSILGFATIMAHSETIEDRMQCLGAVQGSGTTLLQIIDDVIELSQLEAKEVTLHRDYLDLNKLVSKTVDEARPMRKPGVDMTFCAAPDITVRGDEKKIQLVLKHLLGNANKYTEHGSIDVTTSKDSRYAYVRVADTGPGMSTEIQNHIFERFFQASSYIQGTGLGLAIVHELVTLWEGSINVESEPGKGTSITFSIPLDNNYYQPIRK